MSTQYKINNASKVWMLSVALSFDLIQLLTPRLFDTVIAAFAAMFFMMVFIEKGAITPKASGAMKIARIVLPLSEVIIGNLPSIFLTVWVQIKISRAVDNIIPEETQNIIRARRLPSQIRQINNHKRFIKTKTKRIIRGQVKSFGKGRRGVETTQRQNT